MVEGEKIEKEQAQAKEQKEKASKDKPEAKPTQPQQAAGSGRSCLTPRIFLY